MTTNDIAQIPYFVHEGELDRMARVNKRMIILCVVLAALDLVTLILAHDK
jgi:hypothetical protein